MEIERVRGGRESQRGRGARGGGGGGGGGEGGFWLSSSRSPCWVPAEDSWDRQQGLNVCWVSLSLSLSLTRGSQEGEREGLLSITSTGSKLRANTTQSVCVCVCVCVPVWVCVGKEIISACEESAGFTRRCLLLHLNGKRVESDEFWGLGSKHTTSPTHYTSLCNRTTNNFPLDPKVCISNYWYNKSWQHFKKIRISPKKIENHLDSSLDSCARRARANVCFVLVAWSMKHGHQ